MFEPRCWPMRTRPGKRGTRVNWIRSSGRPYGRPGWWRIQPPKPSCRRCLRGLNKMSLQPLCFVVMPFGKKKDPSRPRKPAIDFNDIYDQAIEPAIRDAGLKPKRADKDEAGGIIHKTMFEDLLLCDYVVADLT